MMKSSLPPYAHIIISLSMSLASAQNTVAQDRSPPGADMDTQLSRMQKDMNAMLQQIAQFRQKSRLQENIHQMQSQVDKLQNTTDPKERQKLMQEHLNTVQEHMQMIQSMSESELGSDGKKEPAQPSHALPGGMMYGPRPMGLPGGMIYGPGMMAGPQGHPGVMIGRYGRR